MQQEKRKINKFKLISAIEMIVILLLIIALVISLASDNSQKSVTVSANNKPIDIKKTEAHYQFDSKKTAAIYRKKQF